LFRAAARAGNVSRIFDKCKLRALLDYSSINTIGLEWWR